MYGYIYMTTNLVNGKKYIGKKKSETFLHEQYLGSGTYLNRAIDKYGKENFKVELIEECEDKDILNEREKYWISHYRSVENINLYNVAQGGEGGDTISGLNEIDYNAYIDKISKPRSEEFKQAQSKRFCGENNPMYGKHYKATWDRTSENNPFYGKHHTSEFRSKISNQNRGRKHTPEELDKMRKSHLGKKHSEETKRKMSESRKKYWNNKKGSTTIESIDKEKNLVE